MIIGLDDAEERPTLASSSSSILDAESDSESLDSSELNSSLSSVVCLTGAGETLVLVPFTSTELDVESDSEPEVESSPDVKVRLDSDGTKSF